LAVQNEKHMEICFPSDRTVGKISNSGLLFITDRSLSVCVSSYEGYMWLKWVAE